MAIYELEDRIYFDGGLPADIVEVQEDTSADDIENTSENTDTGDSDNSENVSIAPETNSVNSDNSDNSDDSSDSADSNSQPDGLTDSQPDGLADSQADSIAAILDSIDDTSITDDILADQNFLIISADNENFDEIANSLNDNTTLIIYDSDDTYDSIIEQLKVELGDSKAVNIGILDNEKLIENNEKCNDFLDDLKDLQYYDGEINLLEIANSKFETGEDQPITNNQSLITNSNGEWIVAEDVNSQTLIDYFSDDSSFLTQSLSAEASAQGELITNDQLPTTLYFIDSAVEDIDTIIAEIPENAVVVELDEGEGIHAMTDIIDQYTDIDAVHILSQANYAQILLGDDVITADNIDDYSDAFSSWADNLSSDSDILFYGCDIAKEASGQAVIKQIAEWTGVDIAASIDITGGFTTESTDNTSENSATSFTELTMFTEAPNWSLEYTTGNIEATIFTAADYNNHLETYTVTETIDDGTGTVAGTLSWAIAQSNLTTTVDDTINFNLAEGSTITIAGAGLTISDDLAINGNGVTIAFEDGNAALVIDDGVDSSMINVTINDLTVEAYDNTSSDADEDTSMLRNSENLTIVNTSIDDIGYVYAHIPGNVENPKVILVSTALEDADDLAKAAKDNVIVLEYDPLSTSLTELVTMVETALNGKQASSIAFANHSTGVNEFYLTDSEIISLESTFTDVEQQEFWKDIASNIMEDGRIDLLPCNLASGSNGEMLIAAIQTFSGVNVAASTDETGNVENGGDWILETDSISSEEYFNSEAIKYYTELMQENLNFTASDISGDEGSSFGAVMGDVDNDGYLDIYVANAGNQQNNLWINGGDGSFTASDISGDEGDSSGAVMGDVDNDGDLDIYVVNDYNGQNRLWINGGSGSFTASDISRRHGNFHGSSDGRR